MDEVTVTALKQELDGDNPPFVLDVREPHEYDICKLDVSTLIPLGQVAGRLDELDKDADIVVQCKMGGRSAQAAQIMLENGFTKVRNLVGGITAWANEIDPEMPTY